MLRALGIGDLDAFRSCTILYRIHHPETPLTEARRLVAEWIDTAAPRTTKGPPGRD
jgi:hypothetical protein